MTHVGATVASIWGDIFHNPDDETVLDDTLARVRWMYSGWDRLSAIRMTGYASATWRAQFLISPLNPQRVRGGGRRRYGKGLSRVPHAKGATKCGPRLAQDCLSSRPFPYLRLPPIRAPDPVA